MGCNCSIVGCNNGGGGECVLWVGCLCNVGGVCVVVECVWGGVYWYIYYLRFVYCG